MKCKEFIPMDDHIFVSYIERGMKKTTAGIILLDDSVMDAINNQNGVRPRWAKVAMVGPKVDFVAPEQWILVSHGRWTKKITIDYQDGTSRDIWKVDNEEILMVTDEKPDSLPDDFK